MTFPSARRASNTLCCALLLISAILSAAPTAKEAESAAQTWLALVDHQQYAQSWTEAGSVFRTRVPQDTWIAMVGQVREPLGTVASRTRLKVTLTKTLPGVPDGDYAVLQFRTAFEHKAQAIETVTLTLEDGKLRCVGYFIK